MKLSVWAKQQGVSYKTAWRWWKEGKLPVTAEQMPTGTVIIHDKEVSSPGSVALYARVSSADQKNDLQAQIGKLTEFAIKNNTTIVKAVTEIGSGLNGHRPKLIKLLSDASAPTIIVEHRDRLMRFGFEYIEASLRAQGRKIIVVDQSELKDDLVQDMTQVLTSFCARLYGKRFARNKARKAIEIMNEK
ncbi:MAG: IS607 family transposase [Nitrospirae bacterium]|nr:IS607 family transposase [Nitrospirota bacterium]